MNRKLFGWVTFIAVLAGLLAFGWHRLESSSDLCEDVVMQKAVSSDSRLEAIVYGRSCGVFTTGFTTQVALVKNGAPIPDEASNVYSEDSECSQPQIWVLWQGSRSLSVSDNPGVVGRVATFSQKRVTVPLDWFCSTSVAVHYADLPLKQKTKK